MEGPRQITVIQATAILISTATGIGVLSMPRFMVEESGTGASLATVVGILLVAGGVVLMTIVGRRFPRQSIISYSETVLGKGLARLVSLCIIVFFMFSTAINVRGFGDVVKTSILEETPLDVTIISMLVLAALSTRQDINTFAYIHLFYLPLLVLPGMFVFPFALKEVDPINIFPLLHHDVGQIMGASILMGGVFQGVFIITLVMPAMRRPERALTAGLWGVGIAGLLHVIVVMVSLAFFGQEEIQQIAWPTLDLAKATAFPVLERLDAAFLVGWLIVVFTTAYTTYYIVVHATCELFRLRDHRFLTLFLFPFIFFIAMVPKNVKQFYMMYQVAPIGIGFMIGYPLVLWLVALIRGKRGKTT